MSNLVCGLPCRTSTLIMHGMCTTQKANFKLFWERNLIPCTLTPMEILYRLLYSWRHFSCTRQWGWKYEEVKSPQFTWLGVLPWYSTRSGQFQGSYQLARVTSWATKWVLCFTTMDWIADTVVTIRYGDRMIKEELKWRSKHCRVQQVPPYVLTPTNMLIEGKIQFTYMHNFGYSLFVCRYACVSPWCTNRP